MRRLLRDTLVAVVGGLAAALVASLAHADPNVALAAGIGVCVLALVISEAMDIIFGVFGKPLKVKVVDRHAHPINYAAETAAIQLLIKNRTLRAVELPGGFRFVVNPLDNPQGRAELTGPEKASLAQKLGFERETSHHQPALSARAVVPAHGSVSGWIVEDVSRLAAGGHPEITVHFADGLGNQYTVVAKRQGRRPGQLPWWKRLWNA